MVDIQAPAKESNASNPQATMLEQFALATLTKVIQSGGDVDAKDKVLLEMLAWCKDQGSLVVLKSGAILSSDPTSRVVQNCKSLMLSKGIHPGQVYATMPSFVSLMLASGEEKRNPKKTKGRASSDVQ